MKHYIATAGLRGYLPQYCEVYPTYDDAVESLLFMHEIDPDPPAWAITTQEDHNRRQHDKLLAAELRETGFVDLNLHTYGNEYVEVVECNCATPWVHSDSGDVANVLDYLDYSEEEATEALRQSDDKYVVEDIQKYLGLLARHVDVEAA